MMVSSGHENVVLDKDDGIYEKGQVQELPPSGESTYVQKSPSCRLLTGLAEEMCSSVSST